jgi:glycogen debranching enzyme
MWIWDSAFHALGLRHFAPDWARDAIKAVLAKQRPDGFVPHMMTPLDADDSRITQPPILSWATWRVYEKVGDDGFLRYCYPRLKAMVLHDCAKLDKDGSGLSEWESGGASGMDNSPRFDQALGDAVDLNAYLASEMECLVKIADRLDLVEDGAMWTRLHDERVSLINGRMWDAATCFYYDLTPGGGQLKLKTEAGFTPLFAGICTDDQAAFLVSHLTNPGEFWRRFPVPSVSADEPSFSHDMWRGPAWINYNYMIIRGLVRYGYLDLATELRDRTLSEIARWYAEDGVIHEFYDSTGTRSPSDLDRKGRKGVRLGDSWLNRCVRDYHWSAALYIDLILSYAEDNV